MKLRPKTQPVLLLSAMSANTGTGDSFLSELLHISLQKSYTFAQMINTYTVCTIPVFIPVACLEAALLSDMLLKKMYQHRLITYLIFNEL